MMQIEAMHAAELSDADLVAESRNGDREAFGRIVERYQTLIASLTYCATGNLGRSEDLAQETFVSAWKQLAQLREPAKLRPWLCSIARFLISKEFRRQRREPERAAESLEAVDDWISTDPPPPEQVIGDEEKAILWRSLERVPELYREPLVLFYREHESIAAVAQDLGLSDDAVKQRLSRGRKLLQEQFLAFVAGALKQTSPGKTFTLGVIAALPLLATTAKAAAVVTTLAQNGSVAAKTTGWSGFLQAGSKMVLGFAGWLLPIVPLGGYIGYKMGSDRQHGEQARRSVATFWRLMGASMLLLIFLPPLLLIATQKLFSLPDARLLPFARIWTDFSIPAFTYGVAPLSLVIWIWQRRRPMGPHTVGDAGTVNQGRSVAIWVALGMTGALVCLGFLFWASILTSQAISRDANLIARTHYLSTAQVQDLIAHSQGSNLALSLTQFRNGYRRLNADVRHDGTQYFVQAPAENSTLALLAQKGIGYQTRMEGRDFTFDIRTLLWLLSNWAMSLLMPAFCLFLVVAGALTLLPRRDHPASAPRPVVAAGNERRVDKAFAALAACGMVALAVLLALTTDWKVRRVAVDQLPAIIAQRKHARYEVFEYRDGSRQLWISEVRAPEFIAPANESTIELLTRQGISYQTCLADIDWWYRPRGILAPPGVEPYPSGGGRLGLSRSTSALSILVLVAGAGGLLRWAARNRFELAPRL